MSHAVVGKPQELGEPEPSPDVPLHSGVVAPARKFSIPVAARSNRTAQLRRMSHGWPLPGKWVRLT